MRSLSPWMVVAFVLLLPPACAQTASETLLAGTRMRVKLETPVDSKTSRVGDGVEARLIQPVQLRDWVVVPVGTRIAGRVADVRAADKKQKMPARLRLAFDRITLPDGRVMHCAASLQSLDTLYDVDAEGVATRHGVSKGGAVGDVAVGAAAGAGIGGIAGGGKGAEAGAGIGAAVGALDAWAEASSRWWNIELGKGKKIWLRLDQDLTLDRAKQNPPSPAAESLASERPVNPLAGTSLPAAPTVAANNTETQTNPPQDSRPQSADSIGSPTKVPSEGTPEKSAVAPNAQRISKLRILLTDRKSWEASGGFAQDSTTGTHANTRPPKPEILKAFTGRCPAVVVTMLREKADYVVLFDHETWHSPPYKVAVFSREGDAIYSGATQLLGNAVKDACSALPSHK